MVEVVEKPWVKEFMVRKSGVGKFIVEKFMVHSMARANLNKSN